MYKDPAAVCEGSGKPLPWPARRHWKELQSAIWARIKARPTAQCSRQRPTGSIHSRLTIDAHVSHCKDKKQANFRLIGQLWAPVLWGLISWVPVLCGPMISWAGYNPVISGCGVWARSLVRR